MNLKKLLIDLLHNSAKFISHGEIVIRSEEGNYYKRYGLRNQSTVFSTFM